MPYADLRRRRAGTLGRRLPSVVHQARHGDELAWNELVARYAGLVWSVARAHRLCPADAADVTQATWTKLLEHLDDLHEPAAVGGWLATTARRESLRLVGRADRVVPCADVPESAGTGDVADRLLTSERAAELRRALSRLSGHHQALLRMLAADPAPSYEQIGAALDMPIGSIGPTRARALDRLRRELDAA
jgi:RNA polymerase sigma factor (sigma-70 family)